jgi:hypothetical protein
MEKSTLKKIRLYAPGIISLVCVLPFLKLHDLKTVSDKIPESIFLSLLMLVVLILGVIYYAINIRDLLWRRFVQQCHKNVRAKMIDPFRRDSALRGVIDQLTDQEVMRIFYNMIDNDRSLSDQQNDVRFNGAVLTTIIDTILIISFFTIAYLITFLITDLPAFLWCMIVAVPLQSLLWFLKGRVSNKHIRYEDEQLGVIKQLHSSRVRSLLQDQVRVDIR